MKTKGYTIKGKMDKQDVTELKILLYVKFFKKVKSEARE
jgi:hypothetical protein